MYARRLSLIQNKRVQPYPEDPKFIDDIVEEEEKIISWILNLSDELCEYEPPQDIMKKWEKIVSPEIEFVLNNYELVEGDGELISVMEILHNFQKETDITIDIDNMKKSLKEMGFIIKDNMNKNANRVKNSEQQSMFGFAN